MAKYHYRICKKKELRAKILGTLAGSLDLTLKFCAATGGLVGGVGSVAAVLNAGGGLSGINDTITQTITGSIRRQRKALKIPFAEFDDPYMAIKADFAVMVNNTCDEEAKRFRSKRSGPWIVALDDVDRLPPKEGLKVLLALRSIVGGAFRSETGELATLPKVIFLVSINKNTILPALRRRFISPRNIENGTKLIEPDIEIMVEEYLRKLYLPGPTVSPITKETLQKGLSQDARAAINDTCIEIIISLSARNELSHRVVLQTIDCMLMRYSQILASIEEKEGTVTALFVLEICSRLASPEEDIKIRKLTIRDVATGVTPLVAIQKIVKNASRLDKWVKSISEEEIAVSDSVWQKVFEFWEK